eukprot:gb/GFBE01062943.1/.p1 GENE.gb/GFBE01062943.1/~~gb/GFBE01062943.1/.p1  ORF type:complete len:246 (+),score=60.01 gb/GFBE01062943.1/:1-738(+)
MGCGNSSNAKQVVPVQVSGKEEPVQPESIVTPPISDSRSEVAVAKSEVAAKPPEESNRETHDGRVQEESKRETDDRRVQDKAEVCSAETAVTVPEPEARPQKRVEELPAPAGNTLLASSTTAVAGATATGVAVGLAVDAADAQGAVMPSPLSPSAMSITAKSNGSDFDQVDMMDDLHEDAETAAVLQELEGMMLDMEADLLQMQTAVVQEEIVQPKPRIEMTQDDEMLMNEILQDLETDGAIAAC